MAPPIIPSVYHAKGEIGDFTWMILQETYANVLFIFNDGIEFMDSYRRGNGNTWVRPYTINNPETIYPQAANVPVASIHTGGFMTLDTKTQGYIDNAISRIQTIIDTNSYDTIYYAARNDNKIATENFTVSSTIRNYITSAINNLT